MVVIDKKYVKSPLNYVGGKYKLLNQIIPLFPKKINTFYDIFGGGMNVGLNVDSNNLVYNDINFKVVEILNTFYKKSIDELLDTIDKNIKDFNLSKINSEGYLKLREMYNKQESKNPLDLYTLILYSFNNQIRFNSKSEYNMPFGKDRSSFNPTLRKRFIEFCKELQTKNVIFIAEDFKYFSKVNYKSNDFVYLDPPYLISTATYNENNAWTKENEKELLDFLDFLHSINVKFALSNVIKHKGLENALLQEWNKKYKVHNIQSNYKNCNYQVKDKDKESIEVLITNY